MKTMRWHPPGYGGERRDPDRVKRDGWRDQGMLAVSIDDERLSWPERELLQQLGEKLYGPRQSPPNGSAEDAAQRVGSADVCRR